MTTAILEIAPQGHYTYVESIAKIYTANAHDRVAIFTNSKGHNTLKYLENQQITFKIKSESESYEAFFKSIKTVRPERLFVVTIEPYSKEQYAIAQAYVRTDFGCPVNHVVHNVDFWFQQDPLSKWRNIFYKIGSLREFVYRLKIYVLYTSVLPLFIKKIKQSDGKFVVLSESVATELARFVESERIAIIPFSIFDGKILDKSSENTRIRVCMPGFVSAVRRDYFSILNILKQDNQGLLKKYIEWDLLGGVSVADGGDKVIEEAKMLIEQGHIIHFYEKSSVDIIEFDENLAKADIILGNLHLKQGANSTYGKSKETGMIFTMIKAAKPGLVPSEYDFEKTLSSSILTFKNYNEVAQILIHLAQNPSKLLDLKTEAFQNSQKYTPLSIFNKIEKNLK